MNVSVLMEQNSQITKHGFVKPDFSDEHKLYAWDDYNLKIKLRSEEKIEGRNLSLVTQWTNK